MLPSLNFLLSSGLALLVAVSALGCRQSEEKAALGPSGTVILEIQGGEESQRYELPDVPPGTTVAEVLEIASAREGGPEVEMTGSGATAFVRALNGRGTEGNEGWLFYVNDQWAERGVGQTKVHAGDEIRFEYGSWDAEDTE